MNKRILISLSVIGLVAAVAIGGTIAYFSDTETSTGNLFAAGSIDLMIDNECYLNGEPVAECTWELTDLDGEVFFNFSDLKPGDWGEDTVSLHVYSNDAWACINFDNVLSEDNTCTEPEGKDELAGTGGTPGCAEPGELAGELNFFFWADTCKRLGAFPDIPPALPGDNIFQPECDEYLVKGSAEDVFSDGPYILADSDYSIFGEGPLTGSETYYIGKAWCFGDLDFDVTSYPNGDVAEITCDGSGVYNKSQTDSLEGDIIFYAEQARNNDDFSCLGY